MQTIYINHDSNVVYFSLGINMSYLNCRRTFSGQMCPLFSLYCSHCKQGQSWLTICHIWILTWHVLSVDDIFSFNHVSVKFRTFISTSLSAKHFCHMFCYLFAILLEVHQSLRQNGPMTIRLVYVSTSLVDGSGCCLILCFQNKDIIQSMESTKISNNTKQHIRYSK